MTTTLRSTVLHIRKGLGDNLGIIINKHSNYPSLELYPYQDGSNERSEHYVFTRLVGWLFWVQQLFETILQSILSCRPERGT